MATDPRIHHYPSEIQFDPMPRREDTGFDPPKPGEERLWPAQGDEPHPGEEIEQQVPPA
ncbi:hypothetical protein [Pseudomonas akapageensis]|uniref:hypothetical protein n=1 Tax=Pseudomonas akapageensis TaxID=2609961 RepID=UPI0014096C9F|nr:hypothetical protein [Pseudomonas akapageensis]